MVLGSAMLQTLHLHAKTTRLFHQGFDAAMTAAYHWVWHASCMKAGISRRLHINIRCFFSK